MAKIAVLLVAVPLLAMAINAFLSRSLISRFYRWFVAPGVIMHELSHAVFCVLTGAKVRKISMFDKKGGYVEHHRPLIPVFGQVLISLAPFVLGIIAIYFLSHYIGVRRITIAGLTPTYDGVISCVRSMVGGINIHDYKTWILIYLLFSVAVTMNPSWVDLKNIAVSMVALAGIAYIAYRYTNYRPDFVAIVVPEQLFAALTTVVALLILCLVFSIIIFIPSLIIKI